MDLYERQKKGDVTHVSSAQVNGLINNLDFPRSVNHSHIPREDIASLVYSYFSQFDYEACQAAHSRIGHIREYPPPGTTAQVVETSVIVNNIPNSGLHLPGQSYSPLYLWNDSWVKAIYSATLSP